MGLMDWLSPALTVASGAYGAQQQAEAKGKDAQSSAQLTALRLKHQQQQDDALQQLRAKQMANLDSEIAHRDRPQYDPTRGAMIDPVNGVATKIEGLPDREPAPREASMIPGTPEWEHAERRKAEINRDYGYHPASTQQEPMVLVQDESNPDGPGIYTPRSQASGQHAPQKPKAENAMNVAANARLQAAVSEMTNADQSMQQFERELASGQRTINAPAQVLQRLANSFTHDDPLSMLAQSSSLAMLNRTDPELARYIRRGLSFAEGESMISQRPSDFRTKMASFLSTAASGATPELIGDIQSRRSAIMTPLHEVVRPAHAAPPASPGAAKKTYTYGGKTYTLP